LDDRQILTCDLRHSFQWGLVPIGHSKDPLAEGIQHIFQPLPPAMAWLEAHLQVHSPAIAPVPNPLDVLPCKEGCEGLGLVRFHVTWKRQEGVLSSLEERVSSR